MNRYTPYITLNSFLSILIVLSLVTWNVRGMMSQSRVCRMLFKYSQCDIAIITEHTLFRHSLGFLESIDNEFACKATADVSVNVETSRCCKGGVTVLYKKEKPNNLM